MIVGIGCDIVDVSRIQKAIISHGDRFLKKYFTPKELENAPKLKKLRFGYFAKRYAAKEALSKAIGTGIGEGVEFLEIEVLNEPSGKPYINCKKLAKFKVHLSLTDEKKHAVAFVLIEKE